MKDKNHKALESRPFRFKRPRFNFLCPLCGSERSITRAYRPTLKHYLQIGITGILLSIATFPLFSYRVFFVFFILWMIVEFGLKLLYRNELPCPYCGFDASWYKKDVKIAKRLVEEFWEKNDPLTLKKETSSESIDAHQ